MAPLRHRVRRAGRARPTRRLLRARALARPRLGAARPHPRAAEGGLRPVRAARRPRHLRRAGATATQAYQATVVRRHIEALRRIKYRPTGGFAQFCFADGHPAVTWSVLGHDRAPKLRLRRAARRVPAGDRRRRPAARDRRRRATRSRSTCTSSATCARRSTTPRSPPASTWAGGSDAVAVARRHPRRRLRAGRHGADRRARRARAARARRSPAAHGDEQADNRYDATITG